MVQVPVTLAAPFGAEVAVQVIPRTTSLITTPFCGMVSVPVGLPLLFAKQSVQVPLEVTVTVPPMLLVHPENDGAAIVEQTGPDGFGLPVVGTVSFCVELQVTVTPAAEKLTFVEGDVPFAVAVKLWPAGVTVVDWANAGEAPSQTTAASAKTTRWMIDLRLR